MGHSKEKVLCTGCRKNIYLHILHYSTIGNGRKYCKAAVAAAGAAELADSPPIYLLIPKS
jgi:hypothetical protein